MKVLVLVLLSSVTVFAGSISELFAVQNFPQLSYNNIEVEEVQEEQLDRAISLEESVDMDRSVESEADVNPLWYNPDSILGAGTNNSWDDLINLERQVQDYRTTVFASVTASNLYSAYSTGVSYQEYTNSRFNWGVSIEREQFYWKNNSDPRYPKGQEEVYYNQVWMNWFPADNLQLSLVLGGYVRD